jgi:hypothetical protein
VTSPCAAPQVDTAVSYSCPKVHFTMICRICSKDFIFDSVDQKKIVYADILYFVEHVFS